MNTFEYYSAFLETANMELENYLLSDDLFWKLNLSAPAGYTSYPQMTIGNILLFRKYLMALAEKQGSDLLNRQLRLIQKETDRIRKQWLSHWKQKINLEFKSRLRQWEYIVKDLQNDPQANSPYFSHEVRIRVILKLLTDDPETIQDGQLLEMDHRLKREFSSGSFLWEEEFQEAFPREPYWYLWGSIEE